MRFLPAMTIVSILLQGAPVWAASMSPLAGLSPAEQAYYEKVFVYAMNYTRPGEKYDWESYGGKGSIKVDKIYTSKSGSTCRDYDETFTVQGHQGTVKGIACQRGGEEGWCKLKPGNALTCAMEDPANMFGGSWWSGPSFSTPSVSTPNVSSPNVTVPAVNAPDVNGGSMPSAANPQRKADNATSSAADSITKNAGTAAGNATGGGIRWFQNTFR